MKPPRGPGLVKTTRAQLFQSRTFRLVASSDARWGEIFDTADVMSEGAPRGEGSDRSYFGSSNIILLIAPEGPEQTAQSLAGAVALDPHVRLRAMRVARREAAQRAQGPLDRMRTEITVSSCPQGVAVHVEVEAQVLRDRRNKRRGEESATKAASRARDVNALSTTAPTIAPALPAIAKSSAAIALPASNAAIPLPASNTAIALPASNAALNPSVAPPPGAPL
jgi:hypothetical protein